MPDRFGKYLCAAVAAVTGAVHAATAHFDLVGVTVTPHVRAESMRYRRDPTPEMGARVQLFLRSARGGGLPEYRFNDRTAAEHLADKRWAWHDTPAVWTDPQRQVPPGTLLVWHYNLAAWTDGEAFSLKPSAGSEAGDGADAGAASTLVTTLTRPRAWLAAVTFLNDTADVQPDTVMIHIVNETGGPLRIRGCRLHLPESNATFRFLRTVRELDRSQTFPSDGVIPAGDMGCVVARTSALPLTYAAVEVMAAGADGQAVPLWAHLRIKREAFDLSGGWVSGNVGGRNSLTFEPYLKTLKRLHLNTGHIAEVPGYTDQNEPDGLYTKYPLKYFNKLQPLERYDSDAVLPRIHAVEFLGEPQYGGGRPVPPMEVFAQLLPYAATRLATTVTHSEERVWRSYMGLCDYPHYDAYRVTAPSPDAWRRYERWGEGVRIGWGSPLETIGDMCRSLREMSRPNPTAYWSQGAHAGWEVYDRRKRTSPTPDELRLQAAHALATRITSLYWFNLSLESLVKFRDTIDEMNRVGREIRLLESFYLRGAAYRYRQARREGKLDWDLASIVAPEGALLFALDLDYAPDPVERVFVFKPAREATFEFDLPAYLRQPADLFRVDADGVHDVTWQTTPGGVRVQDRQSKAAVYLAAPTKTTRAAMQQRHRELLAYEASFQFDPARNDADFAALAAPVRRP